MNIFIAVTSYEGKILTGCAESLLNSISALKDAGHKITTYFHNGDCYIARARNYCVRLFLSSECDEILFIDCDVAFDKNAILQLLKSDKEVVAGVYPYRTDDPDIIENKIPFPCKLKFDEVTNNCLDEKTGLVSAVNVPAGFLKIKRSVFETMINSLAIKKDSYNLYNFFDQGTIFGSDEWYGEDNAFCKRWRDIGGEIWIEPNITFRHIGTKEYKGNLHEYLTRG